MIIKRDFYLNKFIKRQNNGLVKIITGIRRCGKTFLLFNLFKEYLLNNGTMTDHIIEIAFDDIGAGELRNPTHCYAFIRGQIIDKDKYYILLDEIQLLDRFEEVLNGLLHIDKVDIYVTGSNSKFLSKDAITEFRGRGDEIHILPLSFNEFYAAIGGDFDYAWNEYLDYGGLPALINMETSDQKIDYLKSTFSNVYMRDVIDRHKIYAQNEINTLVDILASSIGSLTNPTKIANTFLSVQHSAYSNKTVSLHLDFLEESYLISKAHRYDIKGRKYISANMKYYFTDIGLRNARLNFRQQEPTHIIENVVYNELISRGYSVDVGVVEVNQKSGDGKNIRKQLEVDFVANLGSQRYYIQVAYDISSKEKQDQEYNSLRKIPDSFKKIVLVNGTSRPWRTEEGYVVMGLKYFLLSPDSLDF